MKTRILLIALLPLFFSGMMNAQKSGKKLVISGTVTDANQNPIPGVIILVDNKKTDVVTDERGAYKIRVSSDAALITAFKLNLGLSEASVNGRTTINFTLSGTSSPELTEKDIQTDDEQVDIGYGTVNRKDLTTTVGKINTQNKKFASYQNIYDMIRGEVPGVQVSGNSITIQGPTSINASTEPLLVVNGMVVSSIEDINPQMVESIEILKGPSASIYGSRGANGVILIKLIGGKKEK